MTTILASAQRFRGVELFEDGLHLRRDVGHEEVLFKNFFIALGAIPLQTVGHAFMPHFFDDEADRVGFALWRMRHFGRQKEDFASADRHVYGLVFVDDAQDHIAFQLVEKFFRFIVMEICPLVRTADHHDNEVARIDPYGFVADWRLEQMTVFVDPLLKIDGAETSHISQFI